MTPKTSTPKAAPKGATPKSKTKKAVNPATNQDESVLNLDPASGKKTRAKKAAPKKTKERKLRGEPKEDLVVFAFRLTQAEREAIHKAAGAAKASRFVRTLAVAAANRDEARLRELVKAAGTTS